MVKRQSINFFLLVYCISILCLACSSPQQSVTIQEKSATEYMSDISYVDEGFAEERLESEMIATLPDDAEYVCVGSNSNYLFLEASNKEESKDVKYYRYNLSNDNIDFLYEPQNWAYIMNPVVAGDSLVLLIITDEAVQNMLPYQVIEINQAGEHCIIMEGVSFYYPSLVVLDDGIVVEDYCLESDKMVSRILYCGKRTKSSEVLLQEEYTENGDGTITGNKISYLGSKGLDIIYGISSYKNELAEGNNGVHTFYQLEVDSKENKKCDFQPGFPCDVYTSSDNYCIVNKQFTGENLTFWHYLFIKNGDKYKGIGIPAIEPHMNDVVFLNGNKIYVQLNLGFILINPINMTCFNSDEFCATCNGEDAYYIQEGKLYKVRL